MCGKKIITFALLTFECRLTQFLFILVIKLFILVISSFLWPNCRPASNLLNKGKIARKGTKVRKMEKIDGIFIIEEKKFTLVLLLLK